jgi:hypothetical protein
MDKSQFTVIKVTVHSTDDGLTGSIPVMVISQHACRHDQHASYIPCVQLYRDCLRLADYISSKVFESRVILCRCNVLHLHFCKRGHAIFGGALLLTAEVHASMLCRAGLRTTAQPCGTK